MRISFGAFMFCVAVSILACHPPSSGLRGSDLIVYVLHDQRSDCAQCKDVEFIDRDGQQRRGLVSERPDHIFLRTDISTEMWVDEVFDKKEYVVAVRVGEKGAEAFARLSTQFPDDLLISTPDSRFAVVRTAGLRRGFYLRFKSRSDAEAFSGTSETQASPRVESPLSDARESALKDVERALESDSDEELERALKCLNSTYSDQAEVSKRYCK